MRIPKLKSGHNLLSIGPRSLQWEISLLEIMGCESFDVVRCDLGPLLQGQTRIGKLKSANNSLIIMSTPLGGGYIIFAFFAVRCPVSDVRRPMSGVTHGFRSFKGKVLELLSPNLVCRLIGSVACLGLLLAVVPLLLTE